MAVKTGPNQSISWGWDFRESGWKTGMDANLVRLDSLLHASVINNTTTAPPGAPTDGDMYIIATGGTGDWSSKDDQIAAWLDDVAAWTYYTPSAGFFIYVVSAAAYYVYSGAAWFALATGIGIPALGTWDDPYVFGAGIAYLWFDNAAGFFRGKIGSAPSAIGDGDLLMWG